MNISPFKFWCQKVLPAVYDDSLSYYELLCKVVDKLNEVITSQNLLSDDFATLTQAFNTLKNYVDNYFIDLDVQDEVNKKVDELAASGYFDKLVNIKLFNELATQVSTDIAGINFKVNALNKGAPSGSFATLAQLQAAYPTGNTNYYIVGGTQWYYWNGSAWTLGGNWNTPAIANNSISFKNIQGAVYTDSPSNLQKRKRYWRGDAWQETDYDSSVIIPWTGNPLYIRGYCNGFSRWITFLSDAEVYLGRNTLGDVPIIPVGTPNFVFCLEDINGLMVAHLLVSEVPQGTAYVSINMRIDSIGMNYTDYTVAGNFNYNLYAPLLSFKYANIFSGELNKAYTNDCPQYTTTRYCSSLSGDLIYTNNTKTLAIALKQNQSIYWSNSGGEVNKANLGNPLFVSSSGFVGGTSWGEAVGYSTETEQLIYKFTPTTDGVILLPNYQIVVSPNTFTYYSLNPAPFQNSVLEINKSPLLFYPKKSLKYSAVGDSNTFGSNTKVAYPQLLSQWLNCTYTKVAQSGSSFAPNSERPTYLFSNQILLIPDDTDIITVCCTYNDTKFATLPLGNVGDKTNTTICGYIYTTLLALKNKFPTIPIVALTSNMWVNQDSELDRNYRLKFMEICKLTEFNLPVFDSYSNTQLNPNYAQNKTKFYADNFHLNEKGSFVFARAVLPVFKANLPISWNA